MGLEVLLPNGQVLAVLNYVQDAVNGPVKWDGSIRLNGTTPLTASAPNTTSVGVGSGQVVAANANRKGLVLTNLSVNNISFGIGVNAVIGNGITLTPNGVWEMDQFTFSTAAINAIASGASSNLAIQEFT
jgi:hypothetical protein